MIPIASNPSPNANMLNILVAVLGNVSDLFSSLMEIFSPFLGSSYLSSASLPGCSSSLGSPCSSSTGVSPGAS